MPARNPPKPGVYIEEVSSFGNSVMPVPTAVPAFIGYTPQATYRGKSYLNTPTRISSFQDFKEIFLLPDPAAPADPVKQYSPGYYLVKQEKKPGRGDFLELDGEYYSVLPDPYTIYYLYNSIRLFYENGGDAAYIVSVGTYGVASNKPMADPAAQIVNPNVALADLQAGLALLKNETEPTLYICPEATLLAPGDNQSLMEAMLLQAEEMRTAVCIFDIIGGRDPDPILYTDDIANFRNSTGSNGLKYGVAYYPWVGTTVMQRGEIDYTNLFGGDIRQLAPLINPPGAPNQQAARILDTIGNPPANPLTTAQYHEALTIASPAYAAITGRVLAACNVLPPSGGMAGVYTLNDSQVGVWKAPANISIVGVTELPIRLSDSEQAGLNVDAVSGKSVNAIRFFNGLGILVWGARTLDGNSNDWRYIPVVRTVTMLEQSMKQAIRALVFEANDANTWITVKNMISSFLTSIWKEGGLQGASAADAFSVEVGLGTTMTAQDILDGLLRVSVRVALVHPAEFIVIEFEQQMAEPG